MTEALASSDTWSEQARRGLAARLEFVAREPAFAKMAFVEMAAAGPMARNATTRAFKGVGPGLALAAHPVPDDLARMVASGISELVTSHMPAATWSA